MKLLNKQLVLFIAITILGITNLKAQTPAQANNSTTKNSTTMKTYLIEREIPGAANLTAAQLKGISQTSCSVLKEMGPKIEWVQSYVAGDKIYCVYRAENEELIREHAKKGGFPANKITEVANVISPATAGN